MKMFDKILCPVDFSENSAKALQWAAYFRKKYGSQLIILHVLDPYPAGAPGGFDYGNYQAAIVGRMQEFLAPMGGEFDRVLSSGYGPQKIVALSKSLNATAILLGTRGIGGAAHVFMGSTSEAVVRASEIPVITISPHCVPPADITNVRVLVPVQSLQGPPSGFARMRKFVREMEAEVTLLHVVEMDDPMFDGKFHANPFLVTTYEEIEKKQEVLKIGARMMTKDLTTEAIIKFGNAADEILSAAAEGKYAYLLMAARKKTFLSRFLESTVYNVICHSQAPVVTIRMK